MKETTTGNHKNKKKHVQQTSTRKRREPSAEKSKRSAKQMRRPKAGKDAQLAPETGSKAENRPTELQKQQGRCAIVIRAYNEEKHIGRLLTGIMRQTSDNSLASAPQIILVDSGSTDATTTIACQYPVKIVHIQPQEFTFGRSLNLGIAAAGAQAEFIVIASAHVYPIYPDWLDKLLAPFADNLVGLTYGKQSGSASTKFSEQQIFAHWFPEARITQPMLPAQSQTHMRQAHPFCNNANAAVRRSLWEKRPYDESLTGLEDLEWARWMMDQGYAIVYVPEAEIIHVHDETLSGVYNRYRREAIAFKQIYPQEYFKLGDFLRLVSANIFSDLRQATRQKALRSNLSSIFWFRWMQFLGTYHGYRYSGPVTGHLRKTFYYPLQNDQTPAKPGTVRDIEPIQYSS